jgi:nucleoside triphosphate pyrophosphatase
VKPLILASTSKIRAQLLQSAGLEIEIIPAGVDEEEMKRVLSSQSLQTRGSDLAEMLAQAKALDISRKNPGRLVIGADQTLQCGDVLFDKARDMEDARQKLLALRGNTHALYSAVACARDGNIIWRYSDVAHLTMREFSAGFLGNYLALLGEEALESVGSYKLEAQGSQLFEKISGDYFTILGLPLLALLSFLRTAGILDQ